MDSKTFEQLAEIQDKLVGLIEKQLKTIKDEKITELEAQRVDYLVEHGRSDEV
jgi:hypothetical protein